MTSHHRPQPHARLVEDRTGAFDVGHGLGDPRSRDRVTPLCFDMVGWSPSELRAVAAYAGSKAAEMWNVLPALAELPQTEASVAANKEMASIALALTVDAAHFAHRAFALEAVDDGTLGNRTR